MLLVNTINWTFGRYIYLCEHELPSFERKIIDNGEYRRYEFQLYELFAPRQIPLNGDLLSKTTSFIFPPYEVNICMNSIRWQGISLNTLQE